MMLRTDNWETELFSYLNSLADQPFEWGKNDCVTFSAGAAEIVTGQNPLSDITSKWKTRIGALKAISNLGFSSLGDAVASKLPEIKSFQARRGDVVICDGEGGLEFVAVVTGHMAVAPSSFGVLHVPREQWKRAFKIG